MSKFNWDRMKQYNKIERAEEKYKNVSKLPYYKAKYAADMWNKFKNKNLNNHDLSTDSGKRKLYDEYVNWMKKYNKEYLKLY